MKRVARFLAVTLLFLVLLPIVTFFAYDAYAFQPHRAEMRAILAQANPEDRNPPSSIRRYILASHQNGAPPSTHVARQLLLRFVPSRTGGMLGWHARFALWDSLVSLHMSQDEIFGLYSTLSYNGQDYGLSALSQRLFAKPLSALSEPEAATVVAVLWAPDKYLRERNRLEQRRDLLLSRIQSGP